MSPHTCGTPLARINGRTLKRALPRHGVAHRFQAIQLKQWIEICPRCDRDILLPASGVAIPFLGADSVMRTVKDYDASTSVGAGSLDFARFKFSRSALQSATKLIAVEDPTTSSVEELGRALSRHPTADKVLEFSEAVCAWGRGQRIWANLLRLNGKPALAGTLLGWLDRARSQVDADAAIAMGIAVKGLAVSFASKHLRMLAPESYPVLDQVLSEGLGFAMNPKGYALFQEMLLAFKRAHKLGATIAQIEGALFVLVRQGVRASAASP